ncbi:hypothetical protein V2J09_013328 [Rumex salicifolius]
MGHLTQFLFHCQIIIFL